MIFVLLVFNLFIYSKLSSKNESLEKINKEISMLKSEQDTFHRKAVECSGTNECDLSKLDRDNIKSWKVIKYNHWESYDVCSSVTFVRLRNI